ncbi:MAG: LysE family translocator [Pseudolabrys sp.]
MLGTHDLWLFVISGLLLALTPGPDTAYIVARSTQFGFRAGATAVLGIAAGILIHIAAAAIGISALIAASAAAFMAVKYLGAAYLVFIGIKMLMSRGPTAAPTAAVAPMGLGTIFRQGFFTNVLNPKVALFFLAFLPQFIDAGAPSKPLAFLFLGLLFNVNGSLWNLLVAWMAGRAAHVLRESVSLRLWIERGLGAFFVLLGIRLAVMQRG